MGPIRDLGPCVLIWDPLGVALDLGPTFGGCMFRSEENDEDIFEDGHGNAPVDTVTMGRVAHLEAPLTRSSLTQLHAVIKGAVLGASSLLVANSVGEAYFAVSKELIAKPRINNVASVNPNEWLHLFRCYPIHNFEFGYDTSGQRVFKVDFKAYPDNNSPTIGKIWRIGPA